MKRMLVGIDESEAAMHAARMAAELASKSQMALTLVYVSMPNLLPPVPYAKIIDEMAKEEHIHVQRILDEAKAKLAAPGLTIDTRHVTGAPAESFVDLAEDPDVQLVVVGSRGRGAVSRVLLGSFADRVVHICKKPVLVVR